MSNLTELDIIRKTKELLLTGGWVKGRAFDGRKHCLGGAIAIATGRRPSEAGCRTWTLLGKLAPGFDSAMRFNDAPETTLEDVIDLLDRAAASLVESEHKELVIA